MPILDYHAIITQTASISEHEIVIIKVNLICHPFLGYASCHTELVTGYIWQNEFASVLKQVQDDNF